MIAGLLKLGGGFLASKAVTVALIAVLSGAGLYVVHVIKDRGVQQEQLRHERQTNRAWQERYDGLQADRALFARFDEALEAERRERQVLSRQMDRKLEELRVEIPDVDDYLSTRAPDELVRVLCEEGTIARTAPACAEDP